MKTIKLHPNANDLTGQKFSKLKAIAPVGRKRGQVVWRCVCDCGELSNVLAYRLRSGHTTSCGCNLGSQPIHGKTGTPEYAIWASMKQRCFDPKSKSFKNYGGRGITVCKRWQTAANFFDDIGPRPSPEYSIERIDNNGNYCPENCKWLLKSEQAKNRRNNRNITYKGETMNIHAWSKKLGIHYVTLYYRVVRRGWSIERAFTTPV